MKAYKSGYRYYKYQTIDNAWTRPNLTANGTMGGTSFACTQSASYSGTTIAFRCFNGDKTGGESDRWQVNNVNTNTEYYITWYNPVPLKISNLKIWNEEANLVVKSYTLYGSNDNSSWVTIKTGTNTNMSGKSSWNIPVSTTSLYKYFRLGCKPNSTTAFEIMEIEITATTQTQTIVEATEDDYDFKKQVCSVFMDKDGKYFAYSKFGRPANSSEPNFGGDEPDVPTEPVTLVGNTKIENGILSGFDADSYAIINYTLPNDLTNHEFEIVVEFTFETLDVSKTVTAILDTNKDKSLCGWGLGVRKGALWYCSGNGETSSYVNRSDYYGFGNNSYKIAITNKGYSQPKVMVTNLAINITYDYGNMPTTDVIHGVIALGMAGSDLGSAIANSAVEALCGTFNLPNCYIEIDGVKVWEGVKTS